MKKNRIKKSEKGQWQKIVRVCYVTSCSKFNDEDSMKTSRAIKTARSSVEGKLTFFSFTFFLVFRLQLVLDLLFLRGRGHLWQDGRELGRVALLELGTFQILARVAPQARAEQARYVGYSVLPTIWIINLLQNIVISLV